MNLRAFKTILSILWEKIGGEIQFVLSLIVGLGWLPLIENFFIKSFYEMSTEDRVAFSLLSAIAGIFLIMAVITLIQKTVSFIKEVSREVRYRLEREERDRERERRAREIHTEDMLIHASLPSRPAPQLGTIIHEIKNAPEPTGQKLMEEQKVLEPSSASGQVSRLAIIE